MSLYAFLTDVKRQVFAVLQPAHGGTGHEHGSEWVLVRGINSTGSTINRFNLVQLTGASNTANVSKVTAANSTHVLGVCVGYYDGQELIEDDCPDGYEMAVCVAGKVYVLIESSVDRDEFAFSAATDGHMTSSATIATGAFGRVVESQNVSTGATRARVILGLPGGGSGGGGGATYGTPALTLSTTNAAGAAATGIRTDATIAAFDATAPVTQAIGDSAATGSAGTAARRDHKHGMPAFSTNAVVLGTAAAAGSATTLIRSDATIAAFDATTPAAIGTAATGSAAFAARRDHVHATGAGTPVTQAFGDVAATGSGPAAAMTDHKHGMPSDPTGGAGTTTITKLVDERIASSTTLQDDDELFFSTVSGKAYVFDCDLIIDMDTNSAAVDIKFTFGEDNTFRGWYYALAPLSGAGAFTLGSVQQSQNRTFDTGAFPFIYRIMGSFLAGGATFKFQWAQNASNTIGIIVKAGSQLRYRRLT